MTDSRLRELERRFKESGAPADELAYLQERVRSGGQLDWESYSRLAELNAEAASEYLLARVERGDLEREKLELAAYCSHEPARVALGASAPTVEGALEGFAGGLTKWGKVAQTAAAVSLADDVLPTWSTQLPEDTRPREAVAAAVEWLECPCSDHAAKAERAAEEAEEALGAVDHEEAETASRLYSCGSVAWAAAAIAADLPEANGAEGGLGIALRFASSMCTGERLRASMSRKLVSWSLF